MDAMASFRLSGKVAIVTGGASGIGSGIAAVLADAGATVVIADRDAAGGRGGRIVNIASAALVGLLGLSGASAFELAEHAITVNTILPGGVATPGAIGAQGPTPEIELHDDAAR